MIKVNLITGFLGSGKTTTIQHLLAEKPPSENWAILVNEFGEVGIDGALLSGSDATVKEIAGGCMCCVNSLSMQVGLNLLISKNRPDRILVEPTGLGHPKKIMELLTSAVYDSILDLQATLCLLDARQLSDANYIDNDNFRDQLAIADVIIANKSDCYSHDDFARLEQWQQKAHSNTVYIASHGKIPLSMLSQPRLNTVLPQAPESHHHTQRSFLSRLQLPGHNSWRRALNQGDGYVSCGWIFNAETCFDTMQLLEWVRLAPVDRIKGVLRIKEGTLIVNRQKLDLHIETRPFAPVDSRIELITASTVDWNTLQNKLLKARTEQG